MSGHIAPEALVATADRLWTFVERRFPGGRVRRELPVFATLGTQVVAGRIDLMVEWDERFAIIDHKSFPGRESLWDQKAASFGPQLDLYAQAVSAATGKSCSGLFVHLPVVGAVVEVGPAASAASMPSAG